MTSAELFTTAGATAPGVDFSFFPHPSTSALVSAGKRWVGRYCSMYAGNDTNGKNLLPAEKDALRGAGLDIVLFCEETAGYLKGGYTAGKTIAGHFAAVTKALGMTDAVAFLAADWDATPADQTAINAACDGAASVIGRDRVGLYGDYYDIRRAFDAGKIAYGIQTIAWSGGLWDDPQVGAHQGLAGVVGGVSVDLDLAYHADFGQWPRVSAPTPPPSPQPPTQPEQITTGGNESLRQLAHFHGLSSQEVLWWTARNKAAGFGVEQGGYISAGNWDQNLPTGTIWWVGPHPGS